MAFFGMHVHAFAGHWMPISLGAWLGHWEKNHIAAQGRDIRENVTQQGAKKRGSHPPPTKPSKAHFRQAIGSHNLQI